MSGRKLSGAQSRKSKKNTDQAEKKSSKLFKNFFKKAKSDESESEDDVPATNKTVGQPQGDSSLHEEFKTNQLVAIDIDDDVAKQIKHESQSQGNDDSLEINHTSDDENSVATKANDRAIKPIGYLDESQNIKDSSDDNNLVVIQDVIPAVLLFHDVAYIEFDHETQLLVVSQSLRTKIVSRGSIMFQN